MKLGKIAILIHAYLFVIYWMNRFELKWTISFIGINGDDMLIDTSQTGKRGVGKDLTFWPKDGKGELHIPYVIHSSSKTFFFYRFLY